MALTLQILNGHGFTGQHSGLWAIEGPPAHFSQVKQKKFHCNTPSVDFKHDFTLQPANCKADLQKQLWLGQQDSFGAILKTQLNSLS